MGSGDGRHPEDTIVTLLTRKGLSLPLRLRQGLGPLDDYSNVAAVPLIRGPNPRTGNVSVLRPLPHPLTVSKS